MLWCLLYLILWLINKYYFFLYIEKWFKYFIYIDGLEYVFDIFLIDINLGNCNVNYFYGYNIILFDGLMIFYDYV